MEKNNAILCDEVRVMMDEFNQRKLRAIVVLDNFDHDEVLSNWLEAYEKRNGKMQLGFDLDVKRKCHVCNGEHHGIDLVCSSCRGIYRNNHELRARVRARY